MRTAPDLVCAAMLAGLVTVVVARSELGWIVREGAPIVATELDRDGIRRAVTEQFVPAAGRCYRELLQREPGAKGRVTLALEVIRRDDRGIVDRCEVVDADSDIADARFRGCTVDAMKAVIFDPPRADDRVQIVYPIIFRPTRTIASDEVVGAIESVYRVRQP